MAISERSQTVIVWWALAFTGIYGIALVICLHMVPPPGATKPAAEIASWYAARATEIKVGATVTAYCGAFALPLWAVIAIQIARQEKGRPIWALIAALGGALLSLMLALPPLFWGVAAFTPGRPPEVTSLMHELGVLTLITPVQYNPFAFVPIIVICFLPQTASRSPFPRWYGYFTAWAGLMFEAGPLAFDTRTGPFSWNGLLAFWSPLVLFGLWIVVTAYLLLTALNLQRQDVEQLGAPKTIAA